MKTDTKEHIGMHKFEVAGLGKAPFRFVGYNENVYKLPDGTVRAGGSCDYCGTGIRDEFHIQSADGKRFKVGCNCVEKIGDEGLLQAFKSSPEYRRKQQDIRDRKAQEVLTELETTLEAMKPILSANPHLCGFIDRKTGNPLTQLDYVNWMFDHSGNAGRKALLKWLKSIK